MISVIIPNYNHQKFLEQRIESVLAQKRKPDEIIILDDCSTDNSMEIINKYLKNSKVKFIKNSINTNSTFKQWNNGIKQASGDLIWIAESDDAADNNLLAILEKKLKKPNVALAYCQSYRMDANNNITGDWKNWTQKLNAKQFENDFVMNGKQYINNFLIHKNTIPNASAVLFKKNIYLQIGGADNNIRNCGDWLTWLKILLYGDVSFVARPLNYFRYHSNSVIGKLSTQLNNEKYIEIFDKSMRISYNEYLKLIESEKLIKSIIKTNYSYIMKDIGNEGIFELRKGKTIKGLKKIIKASLTPNLNTGFITRTILKR